MDLRLAVFASGRGSNLQAILHAIEQGRLRAKVVALISDREHAGALDIARAAGIASRVIDPKSFASELDYVQSIAEFLQSMKANFIVLAGYLRMIPPDLIQKYSGRIVNIHPALLPSFGGKGMYGSRVHQAVLDYGCKVSGVTVHLVDERYDAGPPVLQRCVPVLEGDTAESLAHRVLEVEHQILPEALQLFAEDRIRVEGRRVRKC